MKKVLANLEKTTKVGSSYETADTVNKHGAPAWKMTPKEQLEQLCFCGQMGDSFYANAREATDEAIDVLKGADPKDLYNSILRGRKDGFQRTVNILGLIILSQKSPPLFRTAFQEVVRTGGDLKDYIDMNRKVRKFGRSVKTALHDWIQKKCTPFYAVKYRREIADAIRLSRYHAETPSELFALAHYPVLSKDKKALDIAAIVAEEPGLLAFEDCKKAIAEGDYKLAVELVVENDLDPTTLVSQAPKGMWTALASNMGTMMFLKYLNKLGREQVITKELLEDKLSVPKMQKARVFPFRLYIAYLNVEDQLTKNHLASVLDDYLNEYHWAEFNKYSWVVGPDVSGSMTRTVEGSNLTPAVVAGIFSGFFYKGLKDVTLIPWSTGVKMELVGPKGDSVITHTEKIARASGGGTDMGSVPRYLLEQKMKVDKVYLITDSEHWTDLKKGFPGWWEKYHNFHPKAQAILHRVDASGSQPFSPEDAKRLNIMQIFGWSDNVVKYMSYRLE